MTDYDEAYEQDGNDKLHILYCIVCKTPSRFGGVHISVIQDKQNCEECGTATIHRSAENVFDVEALLWELDQIHECSKCSLCEDHHE
jgi:hypothetical protein